MQEQAPTLDRRKEIAELSGRLHGELERVLSTAGVALNGGRPWDIRVLDSRLAPRILREGALGIGESYMDGWWDCERLDEMFHRVLKADLQQEFKRGLIIVEYMKARLFNPQSRSRAFRVGEHHYDIGNDLFRHMLDRRMTYSCGYWKDADDLDAAQEAKLDLVCRKLELRQGMRVLDIGCGWGGAARYAAERYGVEVVGVTVSERQVKVAREVCRDLPVEIRLQDYRELEEEPFDRIFSIGMFEHVGGKNFRLFMEKVRSLLAEDGLFLLHTIGRNFSAYDSEPWFDRYIFPNYMLPSARQITTAAEGLFVLEDWHSFGADYDRTLMAWYRNIEAAWDDLGERYDERFRKMWRYYLLASAGSFRARKNQLWQVVYSPRGVPGGYIAPR